MVNNGLVFHISQAQTSHCSHPGSAFMQRQKLSHAGKRYFFGWSSNRAFIRTHISSASSSSEEEEETT